MNKLCNVERDEFFMKVGFISLGCSKNLIDTEITIGIFKKNKFEIVNNPKKADIIVINTCGFIDSAKQEAIDTIIEMAKYKEKNCKYLIVMGCLVQRYEKELNKLLPEVDLFLKIDDYDKLWEKISLFINNHEIQSYNKIKNGKIKQMPMFANEQYMQRVVSTGENYAYLKIGEGCSNMCTYCAIPYIRGLFVSRPMEDILEEAKMLADKGIKELIIIAQDTTKYGIDIYGESKLPELLEKLCEIENIYWIRFLYSYPEGINDKLIDVVKKQEKIVKYFDVPIQHISDNILKKMNRKTSKENIQNLIVKIRNEIPNVTLRTSLIVGFPGETKKDFDELYDFADLIEFDKLGVFEYSKEEGTPASLMDEQIHHMTKKSRYNKIMSLQQKIVNKKLKNKIGDKIEVLVEGKSLDDNFYIGRTKNDVPEIDGLVYIKDNGDILLNEIILCEVIDIDGYDLIAVSLNSREVCKANK